MKKIQSNELFEQENVEILKVIRTNLTTRGDGISNPIRIITQYWTLNGELLFELDPILLDAKESLKEFRENAYTAKY